MNLNRSSGLIFNSIKGNYLANLSGKKTDQGQKGIISELLSKVRLPQSKTLVLLPQGCKLLELKCLKALNVYIIMFMREQRLTRLTLGLLLGFSFVLNQY